eukprot:TRINITY_DN4793_c0_g1_i3.p1 TRINITY_DN4793_c0_g1~~TRINITY_DN4793_c0_g1_i3.p1  ORF type:complete len:215 (+),score=58.24 TRINITY_DN4793_c0_g1_i3:195-839(+)
MGRRTIYSRRAQGKDCWLEEDHETHFTEKRCACTAEDYECAECFYRPSLSDTCVQECTDQKLTQFAPTDVCKDSTASNPIYFQADGGYRKVDEDNCDPSIPGSQPAPKGSISCEILKLPSTSNGYASSVVVVVSVVLVTGILVFVGLYTWKRNENSFGYLGLVPEVSIPSEGQHLQGGDNLIISEDSDEQEVRLGSGGTAGDGGGGGDEISSSE